MVRTDTYAAFVAALDLAVAVVAVAAMYGFFLMARDVFWPKPDPEEQDREP